MGKKLKMPVASKAGLVEGIRTFNGSILEETDDEPKKKKKRKDYHHTGPRSMEDMESDRKNYQAYLDQLDHFGMIPNLSEEEYRDAVKTVKKMIKYLERGDGEKVYDEERCREYELRFDR